jgi:hypothetical protein
MLELEVESARDNSRVLMHNATPQSRHHGRILLSMAVRKNYLGRWPGYATVRMGTSAGGRCKVWERKFVVSWYGVVFLTGRGPVWGASGAVRKATPWMVDPGNVGLG